jgi:hypothetical protein
MLAMHKILYNYKKLNRVMVSVFASCVVDRGFEPRSAQTKCYRIGIYKNPTHRLGLVQSGPHHHLIEN